MSDLSADLASLKIHRDSGPKRSGPGRVLVLVLGLSAASALAAVGYPRLHAQIFKTEVATTEVALISPVQASISVTSTGYVVPQTTSNVGAKIPGRIARVLVKEGDVVKQGDVLAILDEADQRTTIAAARSRVLAARARSQTARANLAEVQLQVERNRALVDKGALGRATLEDLEARAHSLEEQVKTAEAEAISSEAEISPLRVNLQDRTIVAPISGTVVNKPMGAGELVGPQTGPILELMDFGSLLVETDVPESKLYLIKVGTPSEIVLDAYPSKRYRGKAVEIGKRINRAKATVPIKVQFIDDADGVLPDMSARTSFLTKEISAESMKEAPKRVVPAAAVVDRSGRKAVFVIDGEIVKETVVRVGSPVGSGLELLDGPPPGTRLVSSPPDELADGRHIKEKGI